MRGLDAKFSKTAGVVAVDQDDWQGKDDARTLIEAERIKLHPERHAKAKGHLIAQHNAVKKAMRQPGPPASAENMVASGYRKL